MTKWGLNDCCLTIGFFYSIDFCKGSGFAASTSKLVTGLCQIIRPKHQNCAQQGMTTKHVLRSFVMQSFVIFCNACPLLILGVLSFVSVIIGARIQIGRV
jgi:hypothetical protein